jgi:hypothetical protein
MTKRRKQIPVKNEVEILFKNDRTCCICKDKSKGVQIHHIDENPSNNSLDNLSVVCTYDHDEIHKKGGVTKGISQGLLKKYKYSWEDTVRKERLKNNKPQKSLIGLEKVLFEFEIRKVAYEILSIEDDNTVLINQKMEFLLSLHLFEDLTKIILDALRNIVTLSSIIDTNKSSIIGERIHHFFWHLVGPENVRITSKDMTNLKEGIAILGTLGGFSGQFNKNIKTISSVVTSFDYILNISIWYNLKDIARITIKEINEVIKACEETYDDEKPLTAGIKKLNDMKIDFNKRARKEGIKWIEKLE